MTQGALDGITILDLSRVLAGPSCTQMLGDLGAAILKVERPGHGDDTRKWGPPYLKTADGQDSGESAYYLSANRNKRSIAIDIARPEGQALIHRLLARADVLVENYKVGDLARHGLDWDSLKSRYPKLVYASITGFGQDGPYAARPGYDYLAQGMGGIMSLTGEARGLPMKVPVGIADLMTGMYAGVAILAALRHRDRTGEGQRLDLALLDCQVAWLSYLAQHYLSSGACPPRLGNAHPNVVPYEVFPSADGHFILAIGNDGQFRKFCAMAGVPEMAADPRYASNRARIDNRDTLIPAMQAIVKARPTAEWLKDLEAAGVPAGPVNRIDQVFADPQVIHRQMVNEIVHPVAGGPIPLIANPIKMSATPPSLRQAPPTLGQHTDDILAEAGLAADAIAALRRQGVIA